MKSVIYTVSATFTLFVISYPGLFGISSTSLLLLIIASFWIFLIVVKKEYTILFTFFGYMHPFAGSEISNIGPGLSFSMLFALLLILSSILLSVWDTPFNKNLKIKKYIQLFLVYQVVISVVPNLVMGKLSIPVLLMEKDQLFGILLFFPGYFLGIKYFKSTIVFIVTFGLLYSIFYYLVIFNIFSFIELNSTFIVSGTENIMRYGIEIRQMVKVLIYAIPIGLLLNTRWKIPFLFAGVSTFLFLILNFSRNELLYTTFGILITVYIITKSRIKGVSFSISFLTFLMISVFIAAVGIEILLPKFSLLSAISETIYATNRTGSIYTLSHRFNTILPNQINLLLSSFSNFMFGEGYSDIFRENTGTLKDLGIWDIPLMGTLVKFGLIGFSIYMAIYSQVFKEIFRFLNVLKRGKGKLVQKSNFVEYAFSIALSSYFITSMIFRTFYVTWELTMPLLMLEFSFLMGLFMASSKKLSATRSTL